MEAILILHQKRGSVRSVDLAGYMGYSKLSERTMPLDRIAPGMFREICAERFIRLRTLIVRESLSKLRPTLKNGSPQSRL